MRDLRCKDRASASRVAAAAIAESMRRRMRGDGEASIVVSGGSTPAACLADLALAEVDWSGVEVWLSDERWLPPDHADSNERRVRETLLVGAAAAARLQSMYLQGSGIDARCRDLRRRFVARRAPFACCLVGMGTDGHFASLFPDTPSLARCLDAGADDFVVPVTTAASDYPRVSLTLAALLNADRIILLAFGTDKRRIIDQALTAPGAYPVGALLQQQATPLQIIWAP